MNALADREILELFDDRPDLLAVADAVSATQPRAKPSLDRRRLVRFSALPVAAAVAALVLLVVAAPWQQARPAIDSRVFFQRSLAVIGDRPVLHVAMQYSSTNDNVVDLATGDTRPRVYHGELWTDAKHDVARSRFRIDDGPTQEATGNRALGFLDPAFAGFATQYRDALESGRARIVGQTDVDGRPAVRIRFASAPNADSYEVMTVDAETFVPRTLEYVAPTRGSTLMRISKMESLPFDAALFRSSAPRPRVPNLVVSPGGEITIAEAAQILRHPVIGLPDRTPDSVERFKVTGTSASGARVDSAYVVLRYGDDYVTLARKPGAEALGFGFANATPPEGTIEIAAGDKGGLGWMKRDGLTVVLDVPHDDVLSAARSLVPLG